ncbi:hypothetical protein NGRA_0732 [Nosema granulosis]|uniref:C2H2-type domain-containing protein n=1 Tax=Nosema granulosis TaxID=83296 RepID=A0A9P6KZS2_9MICR|nr:hypothetical protein NGRA_0732 [Nosema granulosis]
MAEKKTARPLKGFYKCPFRECEEEWKDFESLKEHIVETEHGTKDMLVKCPVSMCDGSVECKLHFDWKNTKFLRIMRRLRKTIDSIKNKYYNLTVEELIKERDTIATIIKSFVINGSVTINQEEFFSCRVRGCNKKYKALLGYTYHIAHYRHSLAEMITEYSNINKSEIDELKIKAELADEKYINGFNLVDVEHKYSPKHSFTAPLEFKNDFHNIDPKKDKFISKKKIEYLDVSFVAKYNAPLTENSLIHKLIYKGEVFDSKTAKLAFGMFFYNISEFILSVYFDNQSRNIFVCSKSSKVPDVLYDFKAHPSRIYTFDTNLQLIKTINFDYGAARKIVRSCNLYHFILFKDGKLRKINLNDGSCLEEIHRDGIVDFELLNDDTILCSDGKRLYKIKNNEIIHTSDYLPCAANSIVLKQPDKEIKPFMFTKKQTKHDNSKNLNNKFYVVNDDEENKMLNEIREKLDTYNIYCTTVEGEILAFKEDLTDMISVLYSFTSKLLYFPKFDVFVITDTMNNKSKVLTVNKEFIRTHLFLENNIHCSSVVFNTIVSGGYDGTVYQSYFNYNKVKNTELVKFHRSGSDLLMLDHIDEYAVLSPREGYDYSTLIVDVLEYDHYLFIFLSSGIILKKLIKN